MRITSHTAVVIEPKRTSSTPFGAPRTPSSPSASSAIKPAGLSTSATARADPFASVFASFSQQLATATPTPVATTTTAAPTTPATGMAALVAAIQNGTFQGTLVTDPTQLKETTPWGTDTMPNFYYASDQTANQLAQLLGGQVVQMPAFGQLPGSSEPNANFIQLPNGMTFNAADVAYYARTGTPGGAAQLTADLTQTINQSSAWANFYKNGGPMPSFPEGYIGPPISGLVYPPGTVASDGTVINPSA